MIVSAYMNSNRLRSLPTACREDFVRSDFAVPLFRASEAVMLLVTV